MKLGKYEHGAIRSGNYAYVELKEGNQFQFMRNIAMSYLPLGEYKVEDGVLILMDGLETQYKFKIDGDTLLFQKGKSIETELYEDGEKFVFRKKMSKGKDSHRGVSAHKKVACHN